ncbi:MAG: AIR carboxylase family protein [Spirochaetales bacterium]|nr:AIR carboxylase family protein [Spirochaetales bacterium]
MSAEGFWDRVRTKKGCAVVVAGSDSDRGHIEAIVESLAAYRIPCEVRICSAHKTPGALLELVREYEEADGAIAFVAVAGGTDALSGSLSFLALNPVISCPPDAPNDSCLRNPPGSSNATINDPRNVGRFIAQLYAPFNLEYRELVRQSREEKVKKLAAKDREFRESFGA